MARTQAKILCSIWTNPDWLALTDSAQRLYFVILSQPRLNIAGCIDLMPERWARLSADGNVDTVMAALEELAAAEFVAVDGDELVVRTFTQHDLGHGAVNGNLVKGMWSAWEAIVSPFLRMVVVDNLPEKLWTMKGVEVPDAALKQRSEPRSEPQIEPRFPAREASDAPAGTETGPDQHEQPQSEPRIEPQSEPSVDLFPVPCSLLPATSSSLRTTPAPDPADSSHDDEQAAAPPPAPAPDEQTIRRTAALVGRAVADTQAGIGNPQAYAAGVTRQILDPAGDGIDRERITRQLVAGLTPDAIAATWGSDPFGFVTASTPDGPVGPDTAGHYAALEARRREQMADQEPAPPELARAAAAAARAALRKEPA